MSQMTPKQAYNNAVARIAQVKRNGRTELSLSGLGLASVPNSLGELSHLQSLDLSDNHLTDLPQILSKLSQLQSLDLGGNQLMIVPKSLGEFSHLQNLDLSQLQSLDLSDNQLTAVLEILGELVQLQDLDLDRNLLKTVPNILRGLTQLQDLNLDRNHLRTVPNILRELTQLQNLNLSFNQLTTVPNWMCELTQLQFLGLSGNQLTAVPNSLGELTQLHTLDLGYNELTAIPDSLGDLNQLKYLDLSDNQLTSISDWLVDMFDLESLYIAGNPIAQPPPEQLGKALILTLRPSKVDLDALRRYFAQLRREGEAYFYEAKLLIVGEGGAGKTSLVRKLQDSAAPLPPPEESTDGIDIETWRFPLDQPGLQKSYGINNDSRYHVNIWDFGGQTVYHATHQFFLTKRSVYVLVADTRRQQTDFYDWLKMQETFGADSPIILLKNRNRQHGNECVIENLPYLQKRFPNLKEIVEIDLSKVPEAADWPDLLRYLQKHFLALDHIGVPRPKTWVEMRKTLDANPRDTISHDEYLALCAQQGIIDPEDARQLSDYLHHLGDILHFQDDPILTDLVILKPTWGLDAVYRVLDNQEIAAANGQFTLSQLRQLWHEVRYNNHRDKLLRLMQKFQLCYPLSGVVDTYIAPQLLDIKTPEYKWDGDNDDLQLRYKYPIFMPRGILSRAIVALHHRIEEQRLVWRTGVILRDEYARAEMLELRGEGEIRIRVSGGNRRDLLMEIVRKMDELHRAFPKLRYDKLVPCNCQLCSLPDNEAHFFDIELLNKYRNKQILQIRCEKSLSEVDVLSLVDDALLRVGRNNKDRTTIHQTIYMEKGDYIQGDQMTSNISGDTFNMSGDFRGANVNIKSRLKDVQQTIGTLPYGDDEAKAELQQLIIQLNDALQEAPPEKEEDAEAVAQMAETLVETANSEKPNKMMLQISGEGLKKAAENIAAVMPAVVGIATRIITAVAEMTG